MPYDERSVPAFLDAVASEQVAPAGGTATSLVGAVGAALCEMACIHGAESGVAAEFADVRGDLAAHRDHLMALGRADAEVVAAVFGEADEPPEVADLKRTTGVPMATAEACLAVVELAADVAAASSSEASADAEIGAMLAHGALRASLFTVRHNLGTVDDPAFVDELNERAAEVEAAAARALDEATTDVRLNPPENGSHR
jgi:formiminotetrahydrofolate cyclodeaminase